METKTRKKPVKARKSRGSVPRKSETVLALEPGTFEIVPIEQIDISPLNYRKYFDPEALDAFAAELKIHGVLQNVTLRRMPTGRFELVAGERRYRAAGIAGINTLPAIIRTLTDEQVIEIQLAENIQRENPHPMHEALGIAQLCGNGQSIEEIALRLGKSKQTIYSRLKLVPLIESFQDVFLANKVKIADAIAIASFPVEDQEELFEKHFGNWQDENFRVFNVDDKLSRYRTDLTKAPFNTEDATLVPNMGSCIGCPFNSATASSLFPELEVKAVCSNRLCYANKCLTNLQSLIEKGVSEHDPAAILFGYYTPEWVREEVAAFPLTESLPIFWVNEVTEIVQPQKPDVEDFTLEMDDSEPLLDQEVYDEALIDYERELDEFKLESASENVIKALKVTNSTAECVFFTEDVKTKTPAPVTAKEVQEAIKSGDVTVDLLDREVERLNSRESRAKELDREKVQLSVYEQFVEQNADPSKVGKVTKADSMAVRFLVYNGLHYGFQRKIQEILACDRFSDQGEFFDAICNMTDQQFCYMIRLALTGISDAKQPLTLAGKAMYLTADRTGIDVATIEKEQTVKIATREQKLTERLESLNMQIAEMKLEAEDEKAKSEPDTDELDRQADSDKSEGEATDEEMETKTQEP